MAEAREYPRNLAAERAVLGAMLLDSDVLHEGLERLRPEFFFAPAHREIFGAAEELFHAHTQVDLVTLADVLKRRGKLADIGGLEYLLTLVEDLTTVAAFSHHCSLVEEKHLLRSLIDVSVRIAERASAERDDPGLLLDQAEADVFGIAERRVRRDFVAVGEIIGEVYEAVEASAKDRDFSAGLRTDYDFDELTGGFHRQNLIIVAARPGVGKTALALNIAQNLALNHGVPVAIFSLEMSREALAHRLLCATARVDLGAVRAGRVAREMWQPLIEAVNRLTGAPIYLDDSPALNVLEMRTKARRAKARYNVKLVIVDYLQMVHGYKKYYESRQVEIAEVSSFLKSLAKELDLPVVACAQLSRAVERRISGEPQLSDLRESGAIEQDADVVFLLHQPGAGREDGERPDYAEVDVILAKQRNGPTGRVKLYFTRKYTRFDNMTRRKETYVKAAPPVDAGEAF